MVHINDTEQTGNLGMRIARFRKEKGFTQVELGKKIGLSQVLISDYERGRLRPNPETIIKLAQALFVSTDELLGVKDTPSAGSKISLKTIRRLKKIEELPTSQQKALFKTIDTFLKGAERTS
jgi:transcriptional regulator with XRE-family HTH domain